jgi:hypothetical protein
MVRQEDCSEEKLKSGILTLTNQRIVFQNTKGSLATLSKKLDSLMLDIELNSIKSVRTEGLVITKLVISTDNKIFKFSVFNTKRWAQEIRLQMQSNGINGP